MFDVGRSTLDVRCWTFNGVRLQTRYTQFTVAAAMRIATTIHFSRLVISTLALGRRKKTVIQE
jgi:hypothetical protein